MSTRRRIAWVWLLGGVLPLGLATAFVLGCCALPFHGVLHRFVPLCELATAALGGADEHGGHQHPAAPAEKPEERRPAREAVWQPAARPAMGTALAAILDRAPETPARRRAALWAGAFRCDDDVGARLASLDTLRI